MNLPVGFFLLRNSQDHLCLVDKAHPQFQPFSVDFLSTTFQNRLRKASRRGELLARAMGTCEHVLDATSGLARDTVLLAALGFQVVATERSEIIFALVQDAVARARAHGGAYWHELLGRVQWHHGDACDYMAMTSHECIEAVYLDPMFPEKENSALPKKEMQLLQNLLSVTEAGLDSTDQLWAAAKTLAPQRIVVKRPLHGPSLGSETPMHSFKGKAARFDVYVHRKE